MRTLISVIAILAAGAIITFAALRHFQGESAEAPSSEATGVVGAVSAAGNEPGPALTGREAPEGDGMVAAVPSPVPASSGLVETSSVREPAPMHADPASTPVSQAAAQPPPVAAAEPVDVASSDPEAILRGAGEAYAAVQSLRAEFTQSLENAFLRRTVTSHGTLYQKQPDKLLMRFSDPDGDVLVSDGTYFWIYYPSADPNQVIRTSAAAGAGAVDLRAQFVGDPVARFEFTQEPSQVVAGRDAHVILLVPRDPDAGYKSLRVWLDTADLLARRFEITEVNGNVRRIDLESLEVNPTVPDTLFRFVPPESVRIVDR